MDQPESVDSGTLRSESGGLSLPDHAAKTRLLLKTAVPSEKKSDQKASTILLSTIAAGHARKCRLGVPIVSYDDGWMCPASEWVDDCSLLTAVRLAGWWRKRLR